MSREVVERLLMSGVHPDDINTVYEMGRTDMAINCHQHGLNYADECPHCRTIEGMIDASQKLHDAVNSPKHYTGHPSGIECIQVTESMGFCLGNAVKYIWRADLKNDAIEDLRKSIWYIEREIERRTKGKGA